MALNGLDLALVVLLLTAAVRGLRQGALSQAAAFAGAGLGLVAGAALAPRVASALIEQPGTSLALLTLGLLLTAVAIGQAIGQGVGARLHAAADSAGVGGVDGAAGLGVGVLSLLLVVWLLAATLVQGPFPAVARQVAGSRIVAELSATLPPAPDLFSRVGSYLQRQGFPQVFSGVGGQTTAPPAAAPPEASVAAAQAAAAASTVQVTALGCGAVSAGSGFVTAAGFVVTNAHVVAGGEQIQVRDGAGTTDAVVIAFDPELDLAVLSAPAVTGPPLPFVTAPAERDTAGATLGYPGGQPQLVVLPAAVRARGEAVGRDIYGRGLVTREILTLSAGVVQGDSGGPFVTAEGQVGGVVFAAAATEPDTGYALTAGEVADDVAAAITANASVATGTCRF